MYMKNEIVDERECSMVHIRWKIFHLMFRSRENNNDNSYYVLGVLQSLFRPQKHSGLVRDGSLAKENRTERKHHA